MKIWVIAVWLCAGLQINLDVQAQQALCEGCHGPGGVSQRPTVPTIAAISAAVHADAVYRYKDGALPCTGSQERVTMCASIAGLPDERIAALADYFASQPFVAAKQDFDAEKATTGAAIHQQSCEICHSKGGSDPADDAGILAGQWTDYLRMAMGEYASGEREAQPVMQATIKLLTPEQIEALLHFYASQQ